MKHVRPLAGLLAGLLYLCAIPATALPNDPRLPSTWQVFSGIPAGHTGVMTAEERALGSGMRVDRAWELHTGTPDTVVAVLDSGINWESADLLDRAFLNRGELPFPAGHDQYDVDGDGRLSVRDYADDARVRDANANGVLDAGDLIAAFSDGVDQDGNGYVDDISGWDFHEYDNDPSDRTRFGHGTGEALDSTGAINNGIGGAGGCGNCAFLPLRVNDSFVVDVNAFAAAVRYASAMGVTVVQNALGSVNATPLARRAVDEAYRRGVVIIGSAADENSYHHNYPAALDPVVYPNAIRHDTRQWENATTFVNFNNCSNYGMRVDVAVPGIACSSEATGNLSGITALAASYARSLGTPMTAGEIVSLIKTSATDLVYAGTPSRHATWPGWDTITGYGRVDAHLMLERIRQGRIPPEARILTPEWFQRFDSERDQSIRVAVQVGLPRSGRMRLRVEIAKGVETSGAPFVVVAESPVLTAGLDGFFAELSTSDLIDLVGSGHDADRYRYAYTLRLVVDDLGGNVAEARRSFFYEHDADLVAGMPRRMLGSGESAGFFADLDGDGREELVLGDGAGYVHAYASAAAASSGGELSGFPARTVASAYSDRDDMASIVAPLAGADLDGDGRFDIVAVSTEGYLSVIEPDGSMRAGFPVMLPKPAPDEARPDQIVSQGAYASPVLVDLNGDARLDIVVPGLDGRLHVFDAEGAYLPGYPYAVRADGRLAKLMSSPAVVDLDGDGFEDLVFGSNHEASEAGYVFAVSGRYRNGLAQPFVIPGFPTRIPIIRDVTLPTVGTGIPASPAVADIDGDGEPEILIHPFIGKLVAVGRDGRIKRNFSYDVGVGHDTNDTQMLPAFGQPVVGDLSGDGRLSPVAVGAGQKAFVALLLGGKKIDFNHMVAAWDPVTGRMRDGFPKRIDDMGLAGSPLVLDLDGDGRGEVLAASAGYDLRAWNGGGQLPGFPKFTGGWVFGSPTAGDFDGDGLLEVAATTREGYVHIWKTRARAGAGQWLTYKNNPRRTGRM